ncbi:MAG TPA: hypothetical protein VJ941_03435 [Gracilimonas sp.]|nr:hypothetical protein [Gracilimonas sp.]
MRTKLRSPTGLNAFTLTRIELCIVVINAKQKSGRYKLSRQEIDEMATAKAKRLFRIG